MSRAFHSIALLAAWALLSLGALGAAGSAEARSTIKKSDLRFDLSPLSRAARASLKKIDVLLLTDENLYLVWKLEKRPKLADVIVVACSPACLSTDVLGALADWAKGGGGLFLEASAAYMASRFLLPEGYFLEPVYLDVARDRGYAWLDPRSPLTTNVRQIRNELWCSRDGRGRLRLRSTSEPERSLEKALFDLGETCLPVLTWNPQPRDATPETSAFGNPADSADGTAVTSGDVLETAPEDGPAPAADGTVTALEAGMPVLFVSTYEGARVVWYAHDFRARSDDCSPEYDDLRLWSNLVHWLARREPAGHSPDSSSAR
jgi:hypothetical protein